MDRRKKTWRELVQKTPSVEEALADEIDDTIYIAEHEPRCAVCSAGEKDLPNSLEVANRVDVLLLKGFPYRTIQRAIEPLMLEWPPEEKVSYWSIRNHQRRHLHLDELLEREIIERRTRREGKKILEGVEPLLTHAAVLEIIVQRGIDALRAGAKPPDVRDIMAASEKLSALDAAASDAAGPDLSSEFDALVQAVRDVVPPEQWSAIIVRARQLGGMEPSDGDTDEGPKALEE